MKLTVNDKEIALQVGSTISIERTSPFNNENTGSYSFPFAVPTLPNQQKLDWPGKLQRVVDMEEQTFILEDGGIQLLRGEVDYDEISSDEIGMILQSGNTEFMKQMEGKKLADIDYGHEWWPPLMDTGSTIFDKLEEWDLANTIDNGKYTVAPFQVKNATTGLTINVNAQLCDRPVSCLKLVFQENTGHFNYMSLQFKVNFIVEAIFESAGYTILENALGTSIFKNLILFSRIFNVFCYQIETGGIIVNIGFENEELKYSGLMPGVLVTDFLTDIKNLLCLMIEIDDVRKEVRIKFKKDIFLDENLESLQLKELAGWSHMEEKASQGFLIRYGDQDEELDTYTEWPEPFIALVVSSLPEPTTVDMIVKVLPTGRLYITVMNDDDVPEWKRVGRLQEILVGDGENEIVLEINIPAQYEYSQDGVAFEAPSVLSLAVNPEKSFTAVNKLILTIYQGRQTFGGVSFPYASAEATTFDGVITNSANLIPQFLYDNVYEDFMNWSTYRLRGFTKNIALTLPQLISLQWGKRYIINGVVVILDVINYDLPYKGNVEIRGFTG